MRERAFAQRSERRAVAFEGRARELRVPARCGALVFEHGSFDASAVRQTAGMIGMFGCAVWAYCGILIVHRGFYAVGDRRSPLVMSFVGMVINLSLVGS